MQRGDAFFPMNTVKAMNCRFERLPIVDAAIGHCKGIGVGPRHIKGLHAAYLAKQMFGLPRIKAIFGQGLIAA